MRPKRPDRPPPLHEPKSSTPPIPDGRSSVPVEGGFTLGSPPILGGSGSPPILGGSGSPPILGGSGSPPILGGSGSPPLVEPHLHKPKSTPIQDDRSSVPEEAIPSQPPTISDSPPLPSRAEQDALLLASLLTSPPQTDSTMPHSSGPIAGPKTTEPSPPVFSSHNPKVITGYYLTRELTEAQRHRMELKRITTILLRKLEYKAAMFGQLYVPGSLEMEIDAARAMLLEIEEVDQQEYQLILRDDFSPIAGLSVKKQREIVSSIARIVGLLPTQIKNITIETGSVIITCDLSIQEAAQLLVYQQVKHPILKKCRVISIEKVEPSDPNTSEVFWNFYVKELENIRSDNPPITKELSSDQLSTRMRIIFFKSTRNLRRVKRLS